MAEHLYDVVSTETGYQGRIISVSKDVVAMPGGTSSQRDVVVHPGAVGVVALDGRNRVLMVRQYRHPVRDRLEELPAGLLDVAGEPAWQTARRELAEEAGLAADTWHVLVDVWSSPGMTDEAYRVFLARDVHEVERDVQEHEELELTSSWVDLDDAVRQVLDGRLTNAMACLGVMAADLAVRGDFEGLRPADTPWPARPGR